jgi:hypothetical protein
MCSLKALASGDVHRLRGDVGTWYKIVPDLLLALGGATCVAILPFRMETSLFDSFRTIFIFFFKRL